jgi:hypothetical protein
MNGGFALKLACAAADAIEALYAVVRAEGCTIESLRDRVEPELLGERPVAVGVGTFERATVIALPLATENPEVLQGLGEALVARLRCAACVVVDSDAGVDVLHSWNGGEPLTGRTGWFAWDAHGNRCFAITPPRHAVPASALAAELTAALPWSVREAGGRIVDAARREGGAFVSTLPAWRVMIELPEHAAFAVYVDVPPTTELAERVAWVVARELDTTTTLATRTYRASEDLLAVVRASADVELDGLERRGFQLVRWTARVKLDGVGAKLEFSTLVPGDDDVAEIIEHLREAIADERRDRDEAVHEQLDVVLDRQIAAGELEAAAATYREIHAGYFATLPDDRALEIAQAKIRELHRMYRR